MKFIAIDDNLRKLLWQRPKIVASAKLEVNHQKEIIDYLTAKDFTVIRIGLSHVSGFSDTVACSPSGQFWSIEIKKEGGREPSELQWEKLINLHARKAVTIVAYGFMDFLFKFDVLATLSKSKENL